MDKNIPNKKLQEEKMNKKKFSFLRNKTNLFFIVLLILFIAIPLYFLLLAPSAKKEPDKARFPAPSVYNAQGDTLLFKNDNYSILYFPQLDSYMISILTPPFGKNRLDAEQTFLELTLLSQVQACQLKVSITTPAFANPKQAGKDFPLSFCVAPTPDPSPIVVPPVRTDTSAITVTNTTPDPNLAELAKTLSPVIFQLNHQVDLSTTQITIAPAQPISWVVHPNRHNEIYIEPGEMWQAGQTYTITVTAGLTSQDGSAQLKQDFVYSFTAIEYTGPLL